MKGFVLKGYEVTVDGHASSIYFAKSRGRAIAEAWRAYSSVYDVMFGEFLKRAKARRWRHRSERFGEPIEVCGASAFYVSCDRQYIQFVRPESDMILNAHPLDVEPPEARRGTPYYLPDAAHG